MGNTNSSTNNKAPEIKKAPCEAPVKAKPNVDAVATLPILKYDVGFLPAEVKAKNKKENPKKRKATPRKKRVKFKKKYEKRQGSKRLTTPEKKEAKKRRAKKKKEQENRRNYSNIARDIFERLKNPRLNPKRAAAKNVDRNRKNTSKAEKKEDRRREEANRRQYPAQYPQDDDDYLFNDYNNNSINFKF